MEKAGQDEPNLLVTLALNRRMGTRPLVPVRQRASLKIREVFFPVGKGSDVHLHPMHTLRAEDNRFLAGFTRADDHHVLAGTFSGHVCLPA